MPVKKYGTQVPFNDYAWKGMTDVIPRGLIFGITLVQTNSFNVTDAERVSFANGSMNDFVNSISSQAGMTLKYAEITWNETYGVDDNDQIIYQITDMRIGFVVHVDTTGNGVSVLNAVDYPDWFHNVAQNIPTELWSAYLLDPCPAGYHWDQASGGCVTTTYPIGSGYHWDTDTQQYVKDTATNCPLGSKWSPIKETCVISTVDQGVTDGKSFPWIYVLIGVAGITATGGIIYYFVKRKKKRSPPQNNMPNYLE